MKAIFFALLLTAYGNIYAQKIPNLLCHQQIVVNINPKTFAVKKTETDDIKEMDLYRIVNDELFISSPSRSEYRYNKLIEIEKLRFYSGHKTILFDKDFKSAISTHTYEDEIRVIKFRCLINSK